MAVFGSLMRWVRRDGWPPALLCVALHRARVQVGSADLSLCSHGVAAGLALRCLCVPFSLTHTRLCRVARRLSPAVIVPSGDLVNRIMVAMVAAYPLAPRSLAATTPISTTNPTARILITRVTRRCAHSDITWPNTPSRVSYLSLWTSITWADQAKNCVGHLFAFTH
jgi:hypothetical protein